MQNCQAMNLKKNTFYSISFPPHLNLHWVTIKSADVHMEIQSYRLWRDYVGLGGRQGKSEGECVDWQVRQVAERGSMWLQQSGKNVIYC